MFEQSRGVCIGLVQYYKEKAYDRNPNIAEKMRLTNQESTLFKRVRAVNKLLKPWARGRTQALCLRAGRPSASEPLRCRVSCGGFGFRA